jgi:dienelactone hydrolase
LICKGSGGRGRPRRAWGFASGVDAVLKTAPIDEGRLGLGGWSYGGYMTMWGVTQTHRYKAAVAGAGISNWLSHYGQDSIDEWMIPYFGATVGERDAECPSPQSYEFWHALKTLALRLSW